MHLNIKTRRIIPALSLGAVLAYLVYTSAFQRNFLSKTYLAVTLLIFIAGTLAFYLINRNVLVPFLKMLKPAAAFRLAGVAFLISALLLLNFDPQPLYALLPDHSVQIEVPAQTGAQAVYFESLENSLGYIAYAKLNPQGDWREQGDTLRIQPDADFSLKWQGKAGRFLQVVFQPTGEPRTLEIWLDGQHSTLELQNNSGYAVSFRRDFAISIWQVLPAGLAFLLLSTYGLLMLWALLDRLPIREGKPGLAEGQWLWYALPSILVWSLSLLVFWPGMLSNDSLGQWGQALSGQMGDWHPIFHTFLLSVLMRIWYSPALPAMLQITVLSLVFAQGLGLLHHYGTPRWVLWPAAVIFAVFPFNPLFSITLWKDVPYAIALLALFILFLRIALTSGAWLEQKRSWLWLGLAGFAVAAFRQNGPAVAFLSILGLVFFFKPHWRAILRGLAVALLAWIGVKGLLNWAYNPESGNSSQANLILLSHIAAHVEAETELNPDESVYLNRLMPLSDWESDCCYIGGLSYNPDFDRRTYLENFSENLRLTVNLFLRDPLVDLRQQLCASEMNWVFCGNRCSLKSLHAFNDVTLGQESWVLSNEHGLEEGSLLPGLVTPLVSVLAKLGFFSGQTGALLKPALHFYLALVLLIAACLRRRDGRLAVLLLPLLLQTGILAVIIFAPSFRYQYGICLMGLFSLALPFLPKE